MIGLWRRLSLAQQDVLRLAAMWIGYLSTLLVPAKLDTRIIANVTRVVLRRRVAAVNRKAVTMASILSRSCDENLAREAETRDAVLIENAWARIRGLHRGGWTPSVEVEGFEVLQRAQGSGKGTILWCMSFCSSIVIKRGIWQSGIELVHLSKAQHGAWSDSWIARRLLCPMYRRTEKWYLAERVTMRWGGSPAPAVKTLSERLSKANAVVSIVGDLPGRGAVATPFFDAQAAFAVGAPSLAWKTGAALLPAFAVREGAGSYRVVIEEPIEVDTSLGRKAAITIAIQEFSRRLQRAVNAFPGSWTGWGAYADGHPPFAQPTHPSTTP